MQRKLLQQKEMQAQKQQQFELFKATEQQALQRDLLDQQLAVRSKTNYRKYLQSQTAYQQQQIKLGKDQDRHFSKMQQIQSERWEQQRLADMQRISEKQQHHIHKQQSALQFPTLGKLELDEHNHQELIRLNQLRDEEAQNQVLSEQKRRQQEQHFQLQMQIQEHSLRKELVKQ